MKKAEFGCIYIITNKISGEQYVGQTIKGAQKRFREHISYAKKCKGSLLHFKIREYGSENFFVEVIESSVPYVELDNKEIYYIEKLQTLAPNGYNVHRGGTAYRTEMMRNKMSECVSGDKNPMYNAKGEKNHFYGKKHTEETKAFIGKNNADWYNNLEEEKKYAIKQRLKDSRDKITETFGSGMKGKNHSEDTKLRIKEVMIGRIITEEHRANMIKNNPNKKSVAMLDKDTEEVLRVFESVADGLRWLKKENITFSNHGLAAVCRGEQKSFAGYKWKYTECLETIESTC